MMKFPVRGSNSFQVVLIKLIFARGLRRVPREISLPPN